MSEFFYKTQLILIAIIYPAQKMTHYRLTLQHLPLLLLPSSATVCLGYTVSSAIGEGLSHKKKKAPYEQTTGYDPTAGSFPENRNWPGPYSAARLAVGLTTLQSRLPGR